MIQVKSFVFSPFMENTYVVFDESKEALIIDPGCYEKHEKDELADFIAAEGLHIVKLLNTHCHIDHVFGNQFVKDKYNVELYIHPDDEETLRSVKAYAPSYGFQHYEESEANVFITEEDVIEFGNSKFEIIFVPGHAPGHVAFINKDQNICMGGDVLFDGSIGRTDLPGGDFETLIKSIHEKVFPLSDDMIIYSGHGGTTTVGKEKVSNPFCALKK